MRWPLRFQILLPMAGVMVVTVSLVSGVSAYFAAHRTERQIEKQLRDVARTLSRSTFPLTDSVLQQMRGLVGAEFVLQDPAGEVRASSRDRVHFAELPHEPPVEHWEELKLGRAVQLADGRYFHFAVRLLERVPADRGSILHILYPEQIYREAFRDGVYPPLAVGAGALVVMGLIAAALASRLSRPLTELQCHVARIARGEFRPMPQPSRNDEVSDLARSINRMAEMLADYDTEVRRTERLKTLGQLGGGIAHQLRNSATGCRMAIDIHRRECPQGHDCESLDVAERQLVLMEKYLQRFLSLGKHQMPRRDQVNLCEIVEQVLSLVRPSAVHAGVDLQWRPPDLPVFLMGDAERLEQLIVNLLLNAIEAASASGCSARRVPEPRVAVSLRRTSDERISLCVEDSGAGPDAEVAQHLFEPFATTKASGIGLGLCVAREVAQEHGGEIGWDRREQMTCFSVRLPRAFTENSGAEASGR